MKRYGERDTLPELPALGHLRTVVIGRRVARWIFQRAQNPAELRITEAELAAMLTLALKVSEEKDV